MNSKKRQVIQFVKDTIPGVLALYLFGSRAQSIAHDDESDWDFAILIAGYCDPLHLWDWANHLADMLRAPVDLLDFRSASTVMQYEILITGQRWWNRDSSADLYECAVLTEKLDLDELRAGLLDDIIREGVVYGR